MPSSLSPATRPSSVDAKEPVFVQLESALDRPIAQGDVVGLRAGEVLHRRAAALKRHQPQVGLIAAAQTARSISSRRGRERARPGWATKVSMSRRLAADGEDVDVAAGLAAAPQAADRNELDAGACSRRWLTSSAASDVVSASR